MTRLLWLPDALRDNGLTVQLVPNWKTRGHDTFTPRGVLIHHTASTPTKPAPSLDIVTHGRPGIPGPLCQLLIDRNARCIVIASGRANHAGTGGPWRDIPGNRGNEYLVGIEAENDGIGEPWPPAVVDAMERAAAVILTHLGAPAAMCLGHKEWAPSRKIDPARIDMNDFRAAVARRLKEPTVPDTTNPYPTETAEALELLAQHAGYTDPDRKWFGPQALAALHRLKNNRDHLVGKALEALAERETLRAELTQLQALDTVARQGPAVLALIQRQRATLTAYEAELAKISSGQ